MNNIVYNVDGATLLWSNILLLSSSSEWPLLNKNQITLQMCVHEHTACTMI